MIVGSIESLIQSALVQESGVRESLGGIRDAKTLLEPENLRAIEAKHSGTFALALFHPKVDISIKGYLESGSVPGDSGSRLLVLFFVGEELRFPEPLTGPLLEFGIELDPRVHPVHQLAAQLYPKPEQVMLPGLVWSGDLSGNGPVAYVPFGGLDSVEAVAHLARRVFRIADASWTTCTGRPEFVPTFCGGLAAAGIAYVRSEGISLREIFYRALGFAREFGGDLASVLSLGSLA